MCGFETIIQRVCIFFPPIYSGTTGSEVSFQIALEGHGRHTILQTTRDERDFIFKPGFLSVSLWMEVVCKLPLLTKLPPCVDGCVQLGACFQTCPALVTPVWKQLPAPIQPS